MLETDLLKEVIRETNPREVRQSRINPNTNASKGRLVRLQDIMKKLEMG